MTDPTPSEPDAVLPRQSRLAGDVLQRWGPLIALAVLVLAVSVYDWARHGEFVFLSPANVINVLHNWSFVGIIAVGMTFVIIAGGIDLSVGSLVAFAGGLAIWLMNRAIAGGWPEGAAVVLAGAVAIATGTLAGLLNGAIVTQGRVAPFIATLGGLAAYRSLALTLADGGEFRSASPTWFATLGNQGIPLPMLTNRYGNPLVLPWPVLVFAGVALAGWVVLTRTRYGRYVYAIGCNELAARYSAVRVDRVKALTYTLVGGLTGLAALLNASRMNSVSSGNSALMWELDAIAAVVIGGTRMAGGAGSIRGTVVGLLLLGVIANMLNLLQVSPYLQGLVKGTIIVAAVLVQRGRRAD